MLHKTWHKIISSESISWASLRRELSWAQEQTTHERLDRQLRKSFSPFPISGPIETAPVGLCHCQPWLSKSQVLLLLGNLPWLSTVLLIQHWFTLAFPIFPTFFLGPELSSFPCIMSFWTEDLDNFLVYCHGEPWSEMVRPYEWILLL